MQLKLIAVILALMALACSSNTLRRLDVKPIEQKVVFHHSHLNDIWNNQYRGWFIDNEGFLRGYDVIESKRNNWYPLEESGPDSGYISETALLADYQLANQMIYRVPMLELRKYYELLQKAASGEISELTRVGDNEPLSRMVGYLWDADREKYRAVLISLDGDWSQYNTSREAERLEGWLSGLDRIYADSMAEWFGGALIGAGDR